MLVLISEYSELGRLTSLANKPYIIHTLFIYADRHYRMTSDCADMAQSKQSDFSIEHILTKAGEKYNKRKNENTEIAHSCSSNNSHYSDSEEALVSEEDEIVVDSLHHAETVNSANYLQNCMPSFDWLYYTRYRPPKLPRMYNVYWLYYTTLT